jgi:hypothetical protein
VSLKLYRPTPDGGLEPAPVEGDDYRRTLRSRRWKPARFANPEVQTANPWLVVIGVGIFAAGTFIVLVLGYWFGVWS